MKKFHYFTTTAIALSVMVALVSCKGGQKEEPAEEKVDYNAIVDQNFMSIEDFVNVVDGFQRDTKKMLPNGTVWDNNEKEIKKLLDEKGFTTERNKKMEFFISSTKNCEFNIKEENYIYSFSITPIKADSLSAAYYFQPMGDMYVKGEILLTDTCIYDALVNKIVTAGYKLGAADDGNATEEKYEKANPQKIIDCYYFLCSRKEERISLHYDFNRAFEIEMGGH